LSGSVTDHRSAVKARSGRGTSSVDIIGGNGLAKTKAPTTGGWSSGNVGGEVANVNRARHPENKGKKEWG